MTPTKQDLEKALATWDELGQAACIFELGICAETIRALLTEAINKDGGERG